MKEKILKRLDKIVAAALLLFGIVALVLSVKDLRFGSFEKPQGGFAPVIFSSGLILSSAINLVIELRKENRIPDKLKDMNWVKFFLYIGICALYVFLVKKIGVVLDTFMCLLGMLKVTGQEGIVKPLIISVVFSGILWALFTYAMNVPLPQASWF